MNQLYRLHSIIMNTKEQNSHERKFEFVQMFTMGKFEIPLFFLNQWQL